MEVVHVEVGDESDGSGRERLVRELERLIEGVPGWKRVEGADRADRSIRIGPLHGRGWVGIYLDESSRYEEVRDVAARLAAAAETTAVGFYRIDGPLRVVLSEGDGDPFEVSLEESDLSEVLEALSARGVSTDEQTAERGSSEDACEQLARGLGMGERAACRRGGDVADESEEMQAMYLAETTDASIERAGGPPEFEVPDRVRRLEASSGERVQTSCSVGNLGRAVEGVRVRIAGSAIEEGLLEIEQIRLEGGRKRETAVREPETTDSDADRIERDFVFDEFAVAGALVEDVDLRDVGDARSREIMEAHRASRFAVYVQGTAAAVGSGTIAVEVDAGNEEGGTECRSESRLDVSPAPRVPRFAREADAPPHTLRQMQRGDVLFGVLHFDQPLGAWKSLAVDAISRWMNAVASPSDELAVVHLESPRSRPDEGVESAEVVIDREQLAERMSDLEGVHQWTAVVRPETDSGGRLRPEESAGVSYFSCAGTESGPEGRPAPALGFWASGGSGADESVLVEIVDALARSGALLQAVVDRWDWAPALRIRSLPYEIVHGLDSSGHLRVEWLSRYLRAATPRVWLGRRLLEHIDPDELGESAELERLGETLRIDLAEEAKLEELEVDLAPLLPDAEAWAAEAEDD